MVCLTVLLILLTGCMDPGPGTVGQVTDSAGVRLVDHAAVPEGLPIWTVSEDPVLRLGAADGADPDVFGRIDGVLVRSDESMVVVDGLAQELRAFDAAGDHLWTAGGRGEGPGEFMGLMSSAGELVPVGRLPGDSMVANDLRLRRITILDPTGQASRSFASELDVEDLRSTFVLLGTLTDGALFGYMLDSRAEQREGGSNGVLMIVEGDGRVRGGPLTRFPASGPMRALVAKGHEIEGPTLVFRDRFQLRQFSPDGSLRQIVRVELTPLLLDRERYVEHPEHPLELEDTAIARRNREMREQSVEDLPPNHPVFSHSTGADRGNVGALNDAAGNLWLQEFVPHYEDREARWWVLGPDGEFRAEATMPTGFVPFSIGRDYVVGQRLDTLGVAFVERRALLRD